MALSSTISRSPTKTGEEADAAAWRHSPSPRGRTIPAVLVEDDFLIPLLDVARHINSYADRLAQAHGMTRAQLIIIARLEQQPDMSQDELAVLTEVAPMTIARLIDGLEMLGMVKRCPDPERQIYVQLTPAAAPLLRDINRLRANLYSVATKGIEPAVLKKMVFGLRRMEALFLGIDHIAAGIGYAGTFTSRFAPVADRKVKFVCSVDGECSQHLSRRLAKIA
jgi:MarR family transcriptional regulator for hemolysin